MSEHPIEGMMTATMQKIKEMVDVNTIVGDPISVQDGITVIPISKVHYGFASGGSDLPSKAPEKKELFGGGSGAGITISPVGILAINNGKVDLLRVEPANSSIDKAIDALPDFLDKIKSLFKKSEKVREKLAEKPENDS
jgi:sporulation protein YtfJ